MMAIIMGTYYGFYLPAFVDFLLDYDQNIKGYLNRIFWAMFYFNALLNPIIYAWMNRDYRNAFRKILRIKSAANSTATGTDFSTHSVDSVKN